MGGEARWGRVWEASENIEGFQPLLRQPEATSPSPLLTKEGDSRTLPQHFLPTLIPEEPKKYSRPPKERLTYPTKRTRIFSTKEK